MLSFSDHFDKRLYFISHRKPLTSNNEGFRFLKLSEFKQWKSFVRIGQNFEAKMAYNDKKWHVKTHIHKSAMKISIIHSQHNLPFLRRIKVMHAPKT